MAVRALLLRDALVILGVFPGKRCIMSCYSCQGSLIAGWHAHRFTHVKPAYVLVGMLGSLVLLFCLRLWATTLEPTSAIGLPGERQDHI